MEQKLRKKLTRLKAHIANLKRVVVAFSGGVDSTFLVKVALDELGKENVLAVTAVSSTYPAKELEKSKELALYLGFRHKLIVSEELEISNFAENPPDRCYFCKSELFGKLRLLAEQEGIQFVLDGTNIDDTGDYRPGMRAAYELGIISPLKEAELSKEDIRQLSHELALPTWNKPAMACLSSRFPYGQQITLNKLNQVERAEEFLQHLGCQQLRVRHHGELARIEVLPEDVPRLAGMAEEINRAFKALGFIYVTLDLGGYRGGSMNEILVKGAGT